MAAGLVAGSLGHVAMIAVLGGILIVGMQAFEPSNSESAEEYVVTPTPDPVDPNCLDTFGGRFSIVSVRAAGTTGQTLFLLDHPLHQKGSARHLSAQPS